MINQDTLLTLLSIYSTYITIIFYNANKIIKGQQEWAKEVMSFIKKILYN